MGIGACRAHVNTWEGNEGAHERETTLCLPLAPSLDKLWSPESWGSEEQRVAKAEVQGQEGTWCMGSSLEIST